ncbi:MAG: glycosyltransferase [Actinomycetaceae bacterium]|nr:glycosyltransferase [Actinomycetaceae bacterium]
MGDEIQLCWIGRFEAQKDPLLAVEVVAELTSLYQDFRLVMVGTGSLKPLLEAEAARLGVADKIEFTGALNRAGVAELMAGSTVLLLTSHYEGSPRVVAEAGATGLPIVATIEADTDRVLERGVNGARVAGREPCGLAHAIMEAAACESQACIARVQHRAAPQAVRRLLGQDESGI